jgi:hypothetical protein
MGVADYQRRLSLPLGIDESLVKFDSVTVDFQPQNREAPAKNCDSQSGGTVSSRQSGIPIVLGWGVHSRIHAPHPGSDRDDRQGSVIQDTDRHRGGEHHQRHGKANAN